MSFNFGSTNPPAFGTPNPAAGSITFGTPIAQPQAGGLFGTPAGAAAPNFGFGPAVSSAPSFGSTPANTALSFGAPASTNLSFGAPTNANLSFGAPANTSLSFGTPASTGLSFGAPAASAGLNFGAVAPTVSSTVGSYNFGAAAPTLGGFGAQATSAASALSFGAPKTTGTLNFGTGFGATAAPAFGATAAPAFGATSAPAFGTAPAPALSFGLSSANQTTNLLGTSMIASTAPIGGLNFGFGGGTTLGGTGPTLGGFGTLTTKPAASTTVASTSVAPSMGLGGVATFTPITARLGGGGVAATTTIAARTDLSPKDQPLPNEILQTVETFKQFIKQQEQYCSDISKVSIKEFKKVKEDIDAVNNKLSTTEKQLHSNRVTAEKLKYDTAKGLQQIEMAQRTHDTPPGLQYDNNAPLAFFIDLVDSFEREMQQIKLQIEVTDKHVRNIGSASPLNSNDLSLGLRRLHDTFVALAGRLQSIHSQVDYHKEQYLNYRRFILRDASETVTNVFDRPTAEADALQIALRSIDAYHGLSGLGCQMGRLSGGADTIHKADDVAKSVASGPTPFGTSLDQTNVVQAQHQQQLQQQQQQQQQQAVQQVSAAGAQLGASFQSVGAPAVGPPPPYPGTFGATGTTGGLLPGLSQANSFSLPAAGGMLGSVATSPNPLGGFSLTQSSAFPLQKPPVGNKRGKP